MADACPTTATTVYTSGSSAFQAVLQAVSNVLGSAVSIVYQKPGSCEGLDYVLNNTKDTDSALLLVPNGTAVTCTLPAAGAVIDIGFSDVYPSTCAATFDPSLPNIGTGTADFLGPVQAMTIAVPTNSSENAISAEAAYMVFGFAADSGKAIMPWVTPGDIYTRFWDSGTLEMIGKAITLGGGHWRNATTKAGTTSPQVVGNTGAMQTAITTSGGMSGHTNSTIGILSTSGLIAGIKPLAFQATGQSCSWFPSSTSTANDLINVRQGRYEIWGPEHMVTAVDGSGKPTGQNNGNTVAVQTLIDALASTSRAPAASSDAGTGDAGVTSLGEDEVGSIIAAISKPSVGFVPTCAMQVSRTAEIGAEASYAAPAACSCAFEEATGVALAGHTCTQCTAANAGTTCTGATPACHFGYCEAQ
jgi:hypothetical protein